MPDTTGASQASDARTAPTTIEDALTFVDKHHDKFLNGLKDLLRIPSISTLPEHKKDMKRAAQYLADELDSVGLKHVELIKTDGHPLVYGEWLKAEGKPTVLIYGHYDVQPVDPLDLWESDPFEPVVRGDNIYARGAVDDKGQVYGLVKALHSLMRAGDGTLPVNIKVLIEGEEECGGAAIEEYVKSHASRLGCDVVLVADTGMPAPGVPAIVYGLRGIAYTEIHARGARHDLHSGEYGGVGPNPIHALAQVLVGLKGADGRITIPELYERIHPVTDAERALWDRNPVDVAARMKQEMGVDVLPGEQDYDPRERQVARPTLEVHGIRGGFIGDGAKTVIPAEATAKVSLRLPPGLHPAEVVPLLQARVTELCPSGVTMTVEFLHGGEPVMVPLESVYMRAAEQALEQEWGVPPVFERSGGSIPVAALFDSELHAPVIFMGTGLPDDNVHAPNEKYSLPNFYHLIRQAIRFLGIVGSDPAVVSRPSISAASVAHPASTAPVSTTPASAQATHAHHDGATPEPGAEGVPEPSADTSHTL